jgi:hypothetical protein
MELFELFNIDRANRITETGIKQLSLLQKVFMKTLVIHPKDSSTDFLAEIYKDKDWTLISNNCSNSFLREQIKTHDRIIMLGHGTCHGMFGFDRFVIDSTYVQLLREKYCVCIWCNADEFVLKYNLKGFYTGMIISELEEAKMFDVPSNQQWINQSNVDFANAIKLSIDTENPAERAKELYEGNSAVVEFNRVRIYQR